MAIFERLRNLGRRDSLNSELQEEMRAHVEMRTRQNIAAGMSAEGARRDALIRFGNPTVMKERTREMDLPGWLESVGQDVRYQLRMLRRAPGFTALAVLTLAVGIGANSAIFSVVNSVLLRPLPYPNANRLAVIYTGLADTNRAPASTYEVFQIRQHTRELDQVAGIWVTNSALPGEGEPEQVKRGVVTSNFLPMLCARPELGRFFGPEDEEPNAPHAIIISHGVWARRFGSNPNIVGQHVRIGRGSVVVVGVLPENFRLLFPDDSHIPANVDVFDSTPINASDPNGPAFLHLIGRLAPGSNFARAQEDARLVGAQIDMFDGKPVKNLRLYVLPLQEDDVAAVRGTLLLLFGGVAFVLLIGCANLANLLMARATQRLRETTVRAALGASRGRLVRQLLTENLLLGLFGGAAGLAVGSAAVRAILAARPPSLANFGHVSLDWRVMLFTFGASVVTGILFGLAPIIAVSRLDLAHSLKEMGRLAGRGRRRWAGPLVACEVALGFALLCGTGLLMRTFVNILRVDPGFHAQDILTFQISSPPYVMLRQLQQKIAALPGVQSVSAVSHLPLDDTGNWYAEYWKEGAPPEEQNALADHRSILPGYFGTVGATLLRGRDFTDSDDAAHQHVAIVDDVLAQQLFPNEDALGKKINVSDSPKGPYQFERDWAVVVGVVRHIQCHSLTVLVRPQIYVPFQLAPRPMAVVIHTAGTLPGLAESARKQVALLNSAMPVSRVTPLSEILARARSESRFVSILATSLAAVALLLACIGVYGVLSYSVAQRTSEIGIRMAIGAARGDVMRMVLGDGLSSVLLGLSGGFVLSLALTPMLANLLFGVRPRDLANYLTIAAILLLVSALAAFLPARRAMRVDPLIALRYE